MEDKAFDLLTKMYNEFTNKMDGIQTELKEFRHDTNSRLTKIESAIENEIKPDIKASLEGYQLVYEKLKEQEKAIELINNKLEKQDVEITVIKGGKREKVL